jgi:hypothetical protein
VYGREGSEEGGVGDVGLGFFGFEAEEVAEDDDEEEFACLLRKSFYKFDMLRIRELFLCFVLRLLMAIVFETSTIYAQSRWNLSKYQIEDKKT